MQQTVLWLQTWTAAMVLLVLAVAFLVLTPGQVYGVPVSPDIAASTRGSGGMLTPQSFGLTSESLRVVVIAPDGYVPSSRSNKARWPCP